jgi:TonB-dependent starch-binding outer membrane protein SusC
MAGVQVLQSSGQPGSGYSIRIRGVASLSGSSEPLYVIDGVPQFNPDNREATGLGNLNPAEIASVEVLKDAASTAIYGSRAANGVVIITTKSGKAGKTQFGYSTNFGIQNVSNKLDLMSGPEYYDFVMKYLDNSIADGNQTPADKEMAENQFKSVGIANIDWQDKMFQTAFKQNHNISLSGGDAKNKYFILAGYTDQNGIVKSTGFKRYTIRLNLDNKINERFTLNSKITASRSVQNRFVSADGTNNLTDGKSGIASILTAEPTVPPIDNTGKLNDMRLYSFSAIGNVNPLAFLDAVDKRTDYRIDGVIEGRLELVKGLINTTRLGSTYDHVKIDLFQPSSVIMNAQQVQLNTSDNLNLLVENFLSFDKQINSDIGINLTAGVSFQQIQTELFSITGQGLPDDVLKNNALQALSSISPPVTNNIEQTLISSFARANMNIKGKYLLSASLRRDGASQFAEGNKYATFPAASVAWRISEEDFLSESVISNMKLRASWGQSGNQAIQPYQSLTIGNTVSTPTGSGTGLNTAIAPNLPNKSLTWETSTQINLGLDLGFAREKYRFGFDIYEKNTNDLLAIVLLPPSAGFSEIIDNIGEIRNIGVEIHAGINMDLTQELRLVFDGNISKNVNEVIKTNNGKDIITGGSNDRTDTQLMVREGEPLSSFFMIKYLGQDANGNPIYDDLNKDGIIDGSDNQIVGHALPDLTFGFNARLEYKKFSFDMNWQGVSGSMVYNSKQSSMVSPVPGVNKRVDMYDYYPRPSLQAGTLHRPSSRFLEDASYLRLKNVRLNYTVPTNALEFISGFDVYLSAQNLLTITKYSGYDPEVNSFSGGDLRQGIDLSAYPGTRTFTIGFNVKF